MKKSDEGYDDDNAEHDYFIPLVDQRVFGAGIKKKGIAFVPASGDGFSTVTSSRAKINGPSAGDRYLAIVLDKGNEKSEAGSGVTVGKDHQQNQRQREEAGEEDEDEGDEDEDQPLIQHNKQNPKSTETESSTTKRRKRTMTTKCPICKQDMQIREDENEEERPNNSDLKTTNNNKKSPRNESSNNSIKSHHASITHQICLEHSHPPSHLDRTGVGVKYLTGYGWDPDARRGLGRQQDGIRVPVKAVKKLDTAGIGIGGGGTFVNSDDDDDNNNERGKKRKEKSRRSRDDRNKIVKVGGGGGGGGGGHNAKKEGRRLEEDEKKRKAERLRQAFYGEDLSRYLGPDPGSGLGP